VVTGAAVWRKALVVVAFLAATSGESLAQEYSGLIGGFSVGAGSMRIGGTSADPSVRIIQQERNRPVGLGFNLYRNAFLLGVALTELGTSVSQEGEVRVGSRRVTFDSAASSQMLGVVAGAFQHWLTPSVWVRGGVGAGYLDRDLRIDPAGLTITLDKDTGVAVLAATGVDLRRQGTFALSLELHLTAVAVEGLRITAPTVQAGFTWH
jgi:hypothetical protein